jgi:hypothetical protein
MHVLQVNKNCYSKKMAKKYSLFIGLVAIASHLAATC